MTEPDINDVFDSIACSEETINQKGYEDGFNKGLVDGEIDGYHLGYHKGAEIGAELGYYKGVIESYLQLNNKKEIQLNDKIINLIDKINNLINNYPKENIDSEDLFHLISEIRVKYKKFCSLMKIDGNYPYGENITY